MELKKDNCLAGVNQEDNKKREGKKGEGKRGMGERGRVEKRTKTNILHYLVRCSHQKQDSHAIATKNLPPKEFMLIFTIQKEHSSPYIII